MKQYLNIKSDVYCEEDLLGFDKYIDTLSVMISAKDFKTPFCIGIFGKWGSGKTSFMHLLENKLSELKSKPQAIPVWFNPWRYEKEDHLVIPFLKTIEHEIRKYIADNRRKSNRLLEKLNNAAVKSYEAAAAFAYGVKADCKLGGVGIELDAAKSENG